MQTYKGFIFFKTYDLDEYIPLMCDNLIARFEEKVNSKGLFEDKVFTVLIGSEGEEVYENNNFYFLDCMIVFPTSLSYDCTICWTKQEETFYEFYWTSHFPNEELSEYLQG